MLLEMSIGVDAALRVGVKRRIFMVHCNRVDCAVRRRRGGRRKNWLLNIRKSTGIARAGQLFGNLYHGCHGHTQIVPKLARPKNRTRDLCAATYNGNRSVMEAVGFS